MQRDLRPWVTTGVVLVGAGLIAVTPAATPLRDVQHRQVRLVDYDEYDASQLASATEANWQGLESILGSSNWTTDPDISQGLSTLFSDLSTGTSNPVTNPIDLLTEGALLLTSSGDASNAASTALTAVTDNVESALSSGDYSTALTDVEDSGTTVLYAFLNGYPETVGSNGLISPEFGLLTNTADGAATGQIDALAQLSNTIADEVSAVGGGNLTTTPTLIDPGTLELSVNVSTILNDLAPSGTLTLPISLDSLLSDAAPSGTLTLPISLDALLADAAPSGSLDLPITLDQLLSEAAPNGNLDLPVTLDSLLAAADPNGISTSVSVDVPILGEENIPITVPLSTIESVLGSTGSADVTLSTSTLESLLGTTGSSDISVSVSELESLLGTTGSSDITLSVSSLESLLGSAGSSDISIPLSELESALPSTLNLDLTIPEVTGGAVPTYDVDLAQDLLAALGNIAPISSDLPSLLGTDPTLDVTSLLSGVVTDLGLPLSITGGDLTVNLTGLASELLASL
ncbi:hypothetical protein [Mycobacterium sp.]|uniref:hypothetical protein n=2 Tax=Mycobacterium sp. TaxID=1785 RepID=UPI003BB51B06